jgi:hypothetical protein
MITYLSSINLENGISKKRFLEGIIASTTEGIGYV